VAEDMADDDLKFEHVKKEKGEEKKTGNV